MCQYFIYGNLLQRCQSSVIDLVVGPGLLNIRFQKNVLYLVCSEEN